MQEPNSNIFDTCLL